MLTKKDKKVILEALQAVDAKRLNLDHPDKKLVKWFRFGAYSGIQVAAEVIKNLPEKKTVKKAQELS